MATNKKLWIVALAAVFVLSCSTITIPGLNFGPDLSQRLRVGSYITVNYPEDWYGTTDYDIGVISPDYVDMNADDEDIVQPLFIVFPLEEYFGTDWFDEVDNPEFILDEMASEFVVDLRSTTTVEVGNVRWTKGTFRGPFSELPGTWEGWLAIELLPRGGAVIIATAPDSDWDDVESIFDAMMKGIDFSD